MTAIAPGICIWAIFDRDDRSRHEIDELVKSRVQVLSRRDLENYLWDNEIILELCTQLNVPEKAAEIIDEKSRLLLEIAAKGRPGDDIKAISGELYTFTKKQLRLELPLGCGNNPEAFAISTLAPLFNSLHETYKELADIVLAPMQSPTV